MYGTWRLSHDSIVIVVRVIYYYNNLAPTDCSNLSADLGDESLRGTIPKRDISITWCERRSPDVHCGQTLHETPKRKLCDRKKITTNTT